MAFEVARPHATERATTVCESPLPMTGPRQRLDEALVRLGLVATRARARGLVLRGQVTIDGKPAVKPAQTVAADAKIIVAEAAGLYVSFGADKLALALDSFGTAFDPAGRVALDVGASTGGFTDVLLRRGARRVYAADVGHGQLHPSLAADPRVVALEGTDARDLDTTLVPEPAEAITADVSFISLTKALGPALALAAPDAWLVALIKPQFEAGPDAVGSGGIVRDAADRDRAKAIVRDWLDAQPGWRVEGLVTWPGLNGRSNEEYLIGARRYG